MLSKVLDTNDSGEVDYVEFCNQLGKCQKTDPLMVASMTRYSVMELKKIIRSAPRRRAGGQHSPVFTGKPPWVWHGICCRMVLVFHMHLEIVANAANGPHAAWGKGGSLSNPPDGTLWPLGPGRGTERI